jgi:hypothetical protein
MKAFSGKVGSGPFDLHSHRAGKSQRTWLFDPHSGSFDPRGNQTYFGNPGGEMFYGIWFATLDKLDHLFGDGAVVYRIFDGIRPAGFGQISDKRDVDQDILSFLTLPIIDPNDASQQQVFDMDLIFRHEISWTGRLLGRLD